MPRLCWRLVSVLIPAGCTLLLASLLCAADPDRPPDLAIPEADFRKLVAQAIRSIQQDLAGQVHRADVERVRAAAAMLAAYAQYGKADANERAALYERVRGLDAALQELDLDTARKRAADLDNRRPMAPARLPGDEQVPRLSIKQIMAQLSYRKKESDLDHRIDWYLFQLGRRSNGLQRLDLDARLRAVAYQLAVVGELSRANPRPSEAVALRMWQQYALDLRLAAVDLAEAARKQDTTAATQVLATVNASCQACHQKFRPESDDQAPRIQSLADIVSNPKLPVGERTVAVLALAEQGLRADAAVPALIQALKTEDPKFRTLVKQTLHKVGLADEVAPAALQRVLLTADDYVRYRFTYQLANAGPEWGPVVRRLRSALVDPEPRMRTWAAKLLGELGLDASEAQPALERALADESVEVSRAAAQALQRLDVPMHRTLLPSLHSPDPIVRGQAAVALGKIGKPAVAGLLAALRADKPETRKSAAFALGKIGPDARDAIPALRELESDRDATVRLTASQALKKIDPEGAATKP